MPLARYPNPASPNTPFGAGLSNIADALFANQYGSAARAPASTAARDAMYAQHGALYEEQMRKAALERMLAEQLFQRNTPDAIDRQRAIEAGLTVPTMRGIDLGYQGGQDLAPYTPEQIRAHRRANAVTQGYADKTVDPAAIARALGLRIGEERREDIIADPRRAPNIGKAYAATSGHPLRGMNHGINFSLYEGSDNVETPQGTSYRLSEDAQAKQRLASAGEHRARGLAIEQETRTGIRPGPPVIVKSPDTGGGRYVSPLYASQMQLEPGARPGGAGGTGLALTLTGEQDENGNPIYEFVPKAAGAKITKPQPRPRIGQTFTGWDANGNEMWSAVEQKPGTATVKPPALIPNVIGTDPQGRPMVVQTPRVPGIVTAGPSTDSTTVVTQDIKPHEVSKNDRDAFLGAIDRAAGGQLDDKMVEGHVLSRAEQYFITPGSPHYGQHEAAARAALADVLPGGTESKWFGDKRKVKGEPMTALPPIARPAPQQRSTTTTKTGGAQPASPVVAPPLPGKGAPAAARPPNKTDEQLITAGNEAIANGKDRNAVMAQLKAWGVKID